MIFAESTKSRILLNISNDERGPFYLQRAFYKDRTWKTWTGSGFSILDSNSETLDTVNSETETLGTETEESRELPAEINAGDFLDSFELEDGLYEYRYIPVSMENPNGNDYVYSEWCKFGTPDAIGYTFNNYHHPEGSWGTIITPDDCRYTYLWGTDFKATNGQFFSDEQIQFFINEAVCYLERMLNITITKTRIKSQVNTKSLVKGVDYDEEEDLYDYSERKISRYGFIQTRHRPIIEVESCKLYERGGTDMDLTESCIPQKKQGTIKFLKRPYRVNDTYKGINTAIRKFGNETFQPHLFYAVDYTAGFENCDEVPKDLRQIIGKVAAISLLNIIGDGLMSGFSSSSLSMDGVSESFSSTQSATSAYFGARIQVYQKEVETYIKENKFKFGYMPIGCL